ncbi:MAG: hypothetical protein HKN22_08920 [Bacteroidia bacterium]|nr:hypothetical protein [Bacteroidia bacterium]
MSEHYFISAIIAALIVVAGLYVKNKSEKKVYQNIGIGIIVIGAIVALSSFGKAAIAIALFGGIIYYAYENYIKREQV